ncbi:Decaprenyl diphosphate synthase [hydrothermal vent metagenome]|uniref:Decaprenyl diphosphate synthase n=1 Tax=hydrothermal vent metagenome TaxID=652676 RepID=A0A3B0UFJ0_9ZZZZ
MGTNLQPVEKNEPDHSGIDALVAVTADDMEKVNELILSRAASHVEVVPQIALHLIEAGGKRLRPMLTLISARLFGKGEGNQLKYAAAVEFMHNATLLHDDVVDESDMRRGKPAARKIWGNQASVLVGDFLLGQAFMMMVETGSMEALDTLSRAAALIAEGEVLQLSKAKNLATSDKDYMQIIGAKTATLFEAATMVGAMAGQANEPGQKAMAAYGRELGLAFQLVDDVLDYGGVNRDLGKNTGDDLREGKMTLPVILALEKASEAERKIIAGALGAPDASADIFSKVLDIITRYGALETATNRALKHAQNAREAISDLPASELLEILQQLTFYTVSRVR